MSTRKKGLIQLEWVCPNCSARNPGPEKTCGQCGAPQPENVEFQLPSEREMISAEGAAPYAGPDIHCGFCGTRNPGNAETCSQCGGDLKEGRRREAGRELKQAEAPAKQIVCPNCKQPNRADASTCSNCGAPLANRPVTPPPAAAKPRRKTPWGWIVAGVVVLACACAGLIMFLNSPRETVQATVQDVQWQTYVTVEELRAVEHETSGGVPSDAYNVSCRTESEEVCTERTVDRGDGYAEVIEECHTETDEVCRYTVDEWTEVDRETLSGHDYNPVWPQVYLSGSQRSGKQGVSYTVYFSAGQDYYDYNPGDLSEFQQYRIGSTWELEISWLGSVVGVQPAR